MTRVLVVEDDPRMAEQLTQALRDDGHDVELAEPIKPPSLTATIWETHFHHARWRAAQTARLLGWCRLLAIVLALGLALPARAADPAPPPGRAVELGPCEAGKPCPGEAPDDAGSLVLRLPDAPYRGSLVDRPRMEAIAQKREAAERLVAALSVLADDARAKQATAEQDRDSRPQWATLLAVGAGCLVAGLAGGVALAVWAR